MTVKQIKEIAAKYGYPVDLFRGSKFRMIQQIEHHFQFVVDWYIIGNLDDTGVKTKRDLVKKELEIY